MSKAFDSLFLLILYLPLIWVTSFRLRFSYVNPCTLAQYFWLILGLLPYLFLAFTTQIELPLDGLVYIWFFLISMLCGSYFTPSTTLRRAEPLASASSIYFRTFEPSSKIVQSVLLVDRRKLLVAIVLFSFISLIGSTLLVLLNGIDLNASIILIGGQYAGLRNDSILVSSPLLSAMQNISAYLSALFIGRYIVPRYLLDSNLRVLLYTLFPAFLSVITVALMQGQKGIVALFFFLIIGGFILFLLESSCSFESFSLLIQNKNFRKLLLIILIPILCGLALPFLSRGLLSSTGELSESATSFGSDNIFLIYSFGHIPNFLQWFNETILLGRRDEVYAEPFIYTLRDLILLVSGSSDPLPPGLYSDYRYGNIYTIFRGLINDFGTLGSMVVSAVFGFLSNMSFVLCRSSKGSPQVLGQIGCIVFFQLLFQSYIVSALIWKSTLLLPLTYVVVNRLLLNRKLASVKP